MAVLVLIDPTVEKKRVAVTVGVHHTRVLYEQDFLSGGTSYILDENGDNILDETGYGILSEVQPSGNSTYLDGRFDDPDYYRSSP